LIQEVIEEIIGSNNYHWK